MAHLLVTGVCCASTSSWARARMVQCGASCSWLVQVLLSVLPLRSRQRTPGGIWAGEERRPWKETGQKAYLKDIGKLLHKEAAVMRKLADEPTVLDCYDTGVLMETPPPEAAELPTAAAAASAAEAADQRAAATCTGSVATDTVAQRKRKKHKLSSHRQLPCLLLELSELGSAEDWYKQHGKLDEPAAKRLLHNATRAAVACHRISVAHRDIKAANLLLFRDADGHLIGKLSDFGVSKEVSMAYMLRTRGVGTWTHRAPELEPAGSYHDARVDSWSLGCLLLELLSGQPPFWYLKGLPYQVMTERRCNALHEVERADAPYAALLSAEAKTFLGRCMQPAHEVHLRDLPTTLCMTSYLVTLNLPYMEC